MTTSVDRKVTRAAEATTDGELLDALVAEARSDWHPATGADDADDKLFARIAADEAAARLRVVRGGGSGIWAPVAAITAVAAGVAFFMHPPSANEEGEPVAVAPAISPASLTSVTGSGVVRVDGVAVESASLREGQKVESSGGTATFVAPGRVDWVLESGSVVAIERLGGRGGAIVLGLSSGAVEAQVTPVPMGEAFAVDIDGVRVAVHGTHLRVARDRSHVVVDLSEGIISVGNPPKSGSTYGTLVTAPAHVEFSTEDVAGTLVVDHEQAHVRLPVDLAMNVLPPAPVAAAPAPALAPTIAVDEPPVAALPPAITVPRPSVASATPPKPPSPTEIVMAAVQTCAEQTLRSGTVTIVVSSVLTVDVNSDGVARLASFNPPLAPDLQSCVGNAVYATHWSEAGAIRIPIELHLNNNHH